MDRNSMSFPVRAKSDATIFLVVIDFTSEDLIIGNILVILALTVHVRAINGYS